MEYAASPLRGRGLLASAVTNLPLHREPVATCRRNRGTVYWLSLKWRVARKLVAFHKFPGVQWMPTGTARLVENVFTPRH